MHPLAVTVDGCEPAPGSPVAHAARPGLRLRGLAEVSDRERLLAAVRKFRERVDAELGGMYHWFDESSLHITLRALIN